MKVKIILLAVVMVILAALIILLAMSRADLALSESDNAVLRSDNNLQSQTIATQVLNINRFNQTAQLSAQANTTVDADTENTVIEYREILHREKTCDLPVPADVARGLLAYANRLRTGAVHANTAESHAANDSTVAPGGLTYCQAVLWIKPLLATIEKGNNNFAGIREIEQSRK